MTPQTPWLSGFRYVVRGFAVLALIGFIGVEPAFSALPGWVNNPEKKYPSDQYLTAIGSGPTLIGAKEQAKTELSNIFSQRIEAVNELERDVTETSTNKKSKFVESVQMRSDITVKTSSELIGVQIEESKEVFRDGRSTFYALAVLKKDQAASLYEERYRENRRRMSESYRASREASGPIGSLRYLSEALNHGETARRYRNQYLVLESLGANPDEATTSELSTESVRENAKAFARRMEENLQSSSEESSDDEPMMVETPSVPEIEQEITELMKSIVVTVPAPEVDDLFGSGYADQLTGIIEEQFTNLGFRIHSDDSEPDVSVTTRLGADYTTKGRESDKAIRWDVTLRMNSASGENSFGTINESGVTVGLDENMAQSRARQDVNDWLKEQLQELIVGKLLDS